jgi:hypothetical protein
MMYVMSSTQPLGTSPQEPWVQRHPIVTTVIGGAFWMGVFMLIARLRRATRNPLKYVYAGDLTPRTPGDFQYVLADQAGEIRSFARTAAEARRERSRLLEETNISKVTVIKVEPGGDVEVEVWKWNPEQLGLWSPQQERALGRPGAKFIVKRRKPLERSTGGRFRWSKWEKRGEHETLDAALAKAKDYSKHPWRWRYAVFYRGKQISDYDVLKPKHRHLRSR